MGSIDRRLHALEGRGGGCAVCGWGPYMTFEVDDEPDEQEPDEPDYCSSCGRPNVLVIRWPDAEDLSE